MRADRLVAVLLLLQARGRVTAAEVAEELEVSERTARRDLDALGMAGLPVFSTQGRNGGWELAGGGRTDLSGLTADEARALFLLGGPASEATPAVRSALRKLLRALPESFRSDAEAAASRIVVDDAGWEDAGSPRRRPPPRLDVVQDAVVSGQELELGYLSATRAVSSRIVQPLGVAAKGAWWYLVADTERGIRTFRVDRITAATPTGRPAVRPEGFDLAAAWRLITEDVDERRAPVRVRVLLDPSVVPIVRSALGTRLRIGPPVGDGRIEAEARGHHVHSLAGELAGFGAAVEVVDDGPVRARLAEVGRQLVARYAGGGGGA
jgi:predicted DNA-binding transcriptional regulator YafY